MDLNITLTAGQQAAFNKFKLFTTSVRDSVFILTGYAGTGKTTLMRFFIDYLTRNNITYRLLASTGRAAKILRDTTGIGTCTVHSMLYKFQDLNKNLDAVVGDAKKLEDVKDSTGQLYLNFDLVSAPDDETSGCVYIIDEASMIADTPDHTITQAKFGSGKLLTDLMHYNSSGKFVFVGDDAQLPPVNGSGIPALDPDYFRDLFHKSVVSATLTQIMRQKGGNDIVTAAERIRKMRSTPPTSIWGKLPLLGYSNIVFHDSEAEMQSAYIRRIQSLGYNAATYICHANKSCLEKSYTLRTKMPFGRKSNLCVGDLLLVTQNNLISNLQNGDLVRVMQIGERVYAANLLFRHVEVMEIVSGNHFSQYLIEDILDSGTNNLTADQQKALFVDYYIRMKNRGYKQRDVMFRKGLMTDPFLNALRCTYGYALTCHKAQGGEWNDVFIDIPNYLSKALGTEPGFISRKEALQWVYTAITRAKGNVHLVNSWLFV